ncbi:MAG: Catalase [Variovorax sp.]|nr:Catalase [Variovorax sp.]
MPVAEAQHYRFNPFDLTKVWSHKDYPPVDIGTLTLDRNPDNYFAEVEQAAFNPANFVPGIGPSPDKMLQGRLFSYGDTQRYRLGINHTQLPVNCPHATKAANYGRDGAMRFDRNGGRGPNYEPNSFGDAPRQSNEPVYAPLEIHGWSGSHAWEKHAEDSDFVQAGDLYRLMDEAAKERLVNTIAGGLGAVKRQDIVDRAIGYFRQADSDYGARLENAVKAVQAKLRGEDVTIQVGEPAHAESLS